MADHLELGQKGEEIACRFLEEKGYQILECNWRFRQAEVDIIAKEKDILIFVEVKTRSNQLFGAPSEAITKTKETLLQDAAANYMEKIGHDWEIRFDIISIILPPKGEIQITHFPDAFFPDWA